MYSFSKISVPVEAAQAIVCHFTYLRQEREEDDEGEDADVVVPGPVAEGLERDLVVAIASRPGGRWRDRWSLLETLVIPSVMG